MTKTFAERCQLAQQFLPEAQYKDMLTALHTEMLAKLADQPAPAAREWVGLTDEERDRIWSSYRVSFVAIGHIEAKLKEKNT